jgi:hypothetical protein
MECIGGWKRALTPLTNGDTPPGIGTLIVGGVAPLVNGDYGGWTGTAHLSRRGAMSSILIPN